MTPARLLPLLALLAAAGCAAGAPYASPPPVVGFNTTPLVTGAYPAGNWDTAGINMAFEPINSLPPGAANMPVRNP